VTRVAVQCRDRALPAIKRYRSKTNIISVKVYKVRDDVLWKNLHTTVLHLYSAYIIQQLSLK